MRHLNVYNNMAEHVTDDGRASDNTVSFIRNENKVIYNPVWDGTFVDPLVGQTLFDADLIADPTYSTKEELAEITSIGTIFQGSEITSFEEFKYFTGITEIKSGAFDNSSITSLHIPNSVTNLEGGSIGNLVGLKRLIIGDGIENINANYFSNIPNLEYLEFGTKVASVNEDSFNNLSKLKEIIFKDGINPLIIQHAPFSGLSSLVALRLPNNLLEISGSSFSDCTSLTHLNLRGSNAKICNGAFRGCENLTHINVGNGVTEILDGILSSLPLVESVTFESGGESLNITSAFRDLPLLTTLNFPNGVTNMSYAFENCINLKEIIFSDGNIPLIIENSFYNSKNIERLVIGNSVKSIDYYIFNDLSNLTELVFGNGDSPIELFPGNFSGLPNIKTIHLSNRIHEINADTFSENTILNSFTVDATNPAFSAEDGVLYDKDKTKIIKYPQGKSFDNYIIPKHVLEISDDAFDNVIINSFVVDASSTSYSTKDGVLYNKDKTKIIAYPNNKSDAEFIIPNTVVDITPGIFINNNLLKLTIPESVTSLPDSCFRWCSNLTEIIIPESVTSLPNSCFDSCSSLTEIIIPESVTSFGNYCFWDCTNLQAISVLNLIPPTIGNRAFSEVPGDFYVPDESVDLYKVADGWVEYADRIFPMSEQVWESEPTQDGYWVHKDTDVKTYFGLEDSSIEDGIMGYPSWMPDCSEVKLPSGVTGFKTYNWVYEQSWGTQKVTYTGFVYDKETYNSRNEVIIVVDLSNTSVTSLEPNCFNRCTSLTSITLPEGVTSLGSQCFNSCFDLTSINIPESVISLGNSCFYGCISLSSITLPESITSLGQECFSGCTSLTSITLPGSLTSLNAYCFFGCDSLTLATVLSATPPPLGGSVFGNVHESFNIKVRSPYVDDYKTASGWMEFADKISAI